MTDQVALAWSSPMHKVARLTVTSGSVFITRFTLANGNSGVLKSSCIVSAIVK